MISCLVRSFSSRSNNWEANPFLKKLGSWSGTVLLSHGLFINWLLMFTKLVQFPSLLVVFHQLIRHKTQVMWQAYRKRWKRNIWPRDEEMVVKRIFNLYTRRYGIHDSDKSTRNRNVVVCTQDEKVQSCNQHSMYSLCKCVLTSAWVSDKSYWRREFNL